MSGSKQVFEAEIRAVDHVTKPVQAIMAHFKGLASVYKAAFGESEHEAHAVHALGEEFHKTGKEAQKAGEHVAHFAHAHHYETIATHLRLFRGHFGAINLSLGEMGRSVAELMPALGALGIGGGLVGLFELTEHVSEATSEMVKMSSAVGMTVQEFQKLSVVAKMTDIDSTVLTRAMFHLNAAMADASSGKNKDLVSLFRHMGVALKDASGHARSAADVLPEIAEAFKTTSDPTKFAKAAELLFGARGAQQLGSFLKEGREGIEEMTSRAGRAVWAPSQEDIEHLESYHRSMVLAKETVSGFATELGAKLAPVLQPMADAMSDWVVANRDWITTGIADQVGALGKSITFLHLKDVIDDATSLGHKIAWLADTFGGVNVAVGAFVLAIGSPFLSVANALIGIVGGIGRAFVALNVILYTNPIIAIAAAVVATVAALGVAGYEIYEHWDAVKEKLKVAWEAIKGLFKDGIAVVTAMLHPFTVTLEEIGTLLGHVFPSLSSEVATGGGPNAPPLLAPPPTAPGASGKVHVQVDVRNLPAGSTVRTRTEGDLSSDVNVGHAVAAIP